MKNDELVPFHLSIAVADLARARTFYCGILGCPEARSREGRFDFNFFGHHVVAHHVAAAADQTQQYVDDSGGTDAFPVRHFGVILPLDRWQVLADRLTGAGVEFFMKPQIVFPGDVREQAILLCADGCGNVVELKGQAHERIFART